MKHTKGNWQVDERAKLRVHCNDTTIASCGAGQSPQDYEQELANAKLIASAPDLLEAIIELKKWIIDTHVAKTAIDKANKAINKATL